MATPASGPEARERELHLQPIRIGVDVPGRGGPGGQRQRLHRGQSAGAQRRGVAFLQSSGSSISQTTTFAAGTYNVTFNAAQRQNNNATFQTVQVQLDGTPISNITPSGITYATYSTGSVTVTAGSHTLAFVGLNVSSTADNTALIDNVAIYHSEGQFADPSFEGPTQGTGANNDFKYDPLGSSWTFSGPAGLAGNGSGFTSGNPPAPDGTQVAFLQTIGTAGQSIDLPAGSYVVSFQAAQRPAHCPFQTFQVQVDGSPIWLHPTQQPLCTSYTTVTKVYFVQLRIA